MDSFYQHKNNQMLQVLTTRQRQIAAVRLIIYTFVGVILFFLQFEIAGKSALLLDHLVFYSNLYAKSGVIIFALILMLWGAISPWINHLNPSNCSDLLFRILRILGLLIAIFYVCRLGPAFLYQPDILPFLFEKLVLSLAIIVPVGALALGLLIGFGFLEFLGILMQPIMRPIFKTPGKSAIDAVASFAGSYSVGMLITDKLYKRSDYSLKEAVIIATGFSTVSMPFMMVVARTLDLMSNWQAFFWTTFMVTFAVTAISSRLYPICKLDAKSKVEDSSAKGLQRFSSAWQIALLQAHQAPNLAKVLWLNLVDGIKMAAAILPSILSVGLIGLLLAKYTPLFQGLGLLFYPVFYVLGLSEPFTISAAIASGFAEMFLPSLLLKDFDLITRFIAAVTSISSVLFLSGSIPCILVTSIPIKFKDLILIWLLRTYLSLLLTTVIALLLFS